jgi:hypothetical protein
MLELNIKSSMETLHILHSSIKATVKDLKRKYHKQVDRILYEYQENVVSSGRATPSVVELGSKFENTEEEEQLPKLSTSPKSYMMTGALPVTTRPEQRYHNTRSKSAYIDNPDLQAESEEGIKSKSKFVSKTTAASSLRYLILLTVSSSLNSLPI